jgi:hypothetical protein
MSACDRAWQELLPPPLALALVLLLALRKS